MDLTTTAPTPPVAWQALDLLRAHGVTVEPVAWAAMWRVAQLAETLDAVRLARAYLAELHTRIGREVD